MRTTSESSFIEQQRRDQIIQAAIPLLAQHGVVGLTFVRIAEAAGISPGLITYHFRTKAALVTALAQTLTARLDRAMTPEQEARSYLDALHAMIGGFVRHCAAHPDEMLALHQIDVSAPASRRSSQQDADLTELTQMISDGQAEGEYRPGDARTLALVVLAMMQTVPREIAARPVTDVDTFADEVAIAAVHAVADLDRAAVRRRLGRLGQRR